MWPGNRQLLQGSPSMRLLCSLCALLGRLCREGGGIWRQGPLLLSSLTLVPSVKSPLNKWIATSKSPSGEKYTIVTGEVRPAQTLHCWGWQFWVAVLQGGGWWKVLLSSPVKQSLEKLLEMAQPRILQNIHFFWTFLDYFKNFTSWLIASEDLLRNTANTEISKREGKVMFLLTFCALSSWKVPWVLFFPLSASCLHLLGETLNRGKTIRWL